MTRRSKLTAFDNIPRYVGTVKPDSQLELLLACVRLGFGECRATLSLPNGETFMLDVFYSGGNNHLHTVDGTEQ